MYGFDVDGELTLHGVTRPVTLVLDVNGFTRAPTAAPGAAARAVARDQDHRGDGHGDRTPSRRQPPGVAV
ncbi:MAG TPA: YceI family protein [Actinomycetes bacterium]